MQLELYATAFTHSRSFLYMLFMNYTINSNTVITHTHTLKMRDSSHRNSPQVDVFRWTLFHLYASL